MEDLKLITASNIINLRTGAGMTQSELAILLSYSDKSVSKWERGDAVPDAYVLKRMGEIFGVSVDYLLQSHEEWKPAPKKYRSGIVTTIVITGIWTLALLIFIVFWLMGSFLWQTFLYAIPLSLVTLLILNSLWEKGKNNYYIIGALAFSIIATVYFTFYQYNWWQLFLLMIPALAVTFLSSRVKRKRAHTN